MSDKKNKQIEQSFPGTVYYDMSVVGSCAREIGSKPLDVGSQYMSYTGKLSTLVVNQRIQWVIFVVNQPNSRVIFTKSKFSNIFPQDPTALHPSPPTPHHGNTHPLNGGPC